MDDEQTMREFQGIVGRSCSNNSVKPSSSTTQLSLSTSMIVLSKSNTMTMLFLLAIVWESWKRISWKTLMYDCCGMFRRWVWFIYKWKRDTNRVFFSEDAFGILPCAYAKKNWNLVLIFINRWMVTIKVKYWLSVLIGRCWRLLVYFVGYLLF